MTKEINIAKILKDIPSGTRLWSPILGKVMFEGINYGRETYPIGVTGTDKLDYSFTQSGRYYAIKDAELLLFPSKDMRDWSKFFKEGDVLENTTDDVFPKYVIFKKFVDDKYTTFEATNGIILGDVPLKYSIQNTLSYSKVEDENKALEIKKKIQNIVDKKPESSAPEFQPFDKVLVRDYKEQMWMPTLFGFFCQDEGDRYPYETAHGAYKYCIPYNEKTKHLLGTKKTIYGGIIMTEQNKIIAYKGFDKNLKCRDFQYEVGKEYEIDGEIKCCEHGFHACENPLEVWDHYEMIGSRFAQVEQSGTIDKEASSTKVCSSHIKIKAELKLADIINLGVEWLKDITSPSKTKINNALNDNGGNSAKIGSSGYSAQIGSSGDYAKIDSTGEDSVIMCAGLNSKAKAKIGSWITLAEWKLDDTKGRYVPVCVKTEYVDGKKIKSDTWYQLIDGEFKEVLP